MVYTPLNRTKDEIRLLSIRPASSNADTLECTIDVVSLRDLRSGYRLFLQQLVIPSREERLAAWCKSSHAEPDSINGLPPQVPPEHCHRFQWGDFATLSYTWGDTVDAELILINGTETSVTTNLAAALRAFRRLGCFSERFKLWVDYICINQRDIEERSYQVAMMRGIYTQSWTTMAFLGPVAGDSDKALGLLKTLAAHENNGKLEELRDSLQINPAYLGGDGQWLALEALLQRRYWSRLWIVQEAALAPSNMLMFFGDDTITWQQVQDGLTSIHTCLWYVKNQCLQYDRKALREAQGLTGGEENGLWGTENLHHVDKGLARLSRKLRRGEFVSYGDLLGVASATNCAEPLDKVYGLLAFLNPTIADQVVVDYTIEPWRLFSQVAQLCITHDNSVELVRHGNAWNETNTPSWAPDWTCENRTRDMLYPSLPYQADGGLAARCSFSADGRILTVRGVVVDIVKGSDIPDEAGTKEIKTPRKNPTFHPASSIAELTRTALYHTLLGGRVGHMESQRAPVDRERHLFNLPIATEAAMDTFRQRGWTEFSIQGQRYEEWADWRRISGGIQLGEFGRVRDVFTDVIPADADGEALWADFVRFRNMASERKFVATNGGRFGWVPGGIDSVAGSEVQGGDVFCIVFGCSVPLVIRPEGKHYRVLGEGYLQGYMEGNLPEVLKSGQLVAEDLAFC